MRTKNAFAAASIGAMLVAIGLPLTAISASAVVAADTTPPIATRIFPADAARRGALTGNLTATFNEALDVNSVTALTFTLKDDTTNRVVAAFPHVDPLTNVVTLVPSAKFGLRTTLTATLVGGPNGIKDLAGNAMVEHRWTFTTAKSENESYVNRVYEHLFNREVDDNGALHWESELNDVNDNNRTHVSNGITYSAEYRSRLIDDSYMRFLGRTPDQAGLNHWLGEMNRGMTVSQMESGFTSSNEYFVNAGSTNAGLVTKLYSDVLNLRVPSPAEKSFWTARLDDRLVGRSTVAMGFLLSSEHLGTVVDDHYQQLLGRGLDPSGRQTWVSILARGGRDEAVIGSIISSPEFYSHN